mgnify:CR=1 FL=1
MRRARYAIGDLFFVAGQGIKRAAGGLGGLAGGAASAWHRIPLAGRQAIAGVLAVAVLLILFVTVAVPNLPCAFPGGDRCPPPDEADELVPAEALAYVHVNVDPETEQYELLADVAAEAPGFRDQIATRALGLLPGPGGEVPEYRTDIEPWFGGEMAMAVVPGPGRSNEQVFLLEAENEDRARGYAESVATGLPEPEEYRGIEMTTDEGGVSTAQVEGFLVIGSRAGVRAVIDTATGADEGQAPLADDEAAEAVRDELPDHRFLELWVSRAGAEDLIAGSGGALSSLAPFLSPDGTEGAALALSAGEGEIEVAIRSRLNAEREEASPGFFAAFPSFDPSLDEEFESDALAYLGFGDPGNTVRQLLGQAAAEAPGIASGFDDLVRRLRRTERVDVEEVLAALGDEGALGIEQGDGFPYLEFLAKGIDEEKAREALAALQRPVAQSVNPGRAGQAPVFREEDVDGVEVRSLRVSPVVELSYAVFDELMAVASDSRGVKRAVQEDGGELADSEQFDRATDGFEDEVSLLAYLDLGQLLDEAFELGLAEDPAFNAFAGDFRALRALGLAVRIDEGVLETDGRLIVGAPEEDAAVEPELPIPND